MTTKQAIENLQTIKEKYVWSSGADEALDMAMDALRAESKLQQVADTISRQQAIDTLCTECQGRCIPCEHYPCGEVKALENLPSAQPERKKGKWEEKFYGDSVYCSECGLEGRWHWDFCPYCGAEMS